MRFEVDSMFVHNNINKVLASQNKSVKKINLYEPSNLNGIYDIKQQFTVNVRSFKCVHLTKTKLRLRIINHPIYVLQLCVYDIK